MQTEVKLQRNEVEEWLSSPVTERVLRIMKHEADARRIHAGMGGCMNSNSYESGEAYQKLMIEANVYDFCSKIEVEDILTEEELEDEQKEES